MGRPWSAVLELGLGHADPVPSLGASPKGKMVRWISEGVYSMGLLGAKTEIPAYTFTVETSRCGPISASLNGDSTKAKMIHVMFPSQDSGSEFTHISRLYSECHGGGVQNTTKASPANDQSLISAQIEQIANGAHQQLPPPTQTPLAPGQTSGWSIKNATGYELHLYLSGPVERSYVIVDGGNIAVDLPAGSYRIAADVGHGVLPFYAVRQLGDARWSSHFYIAQQH